MIFELVDLSKWKTKKEILKELKNKLGQAVDERRFRILVERQNDLYHNHESDVFIAHSSRGYKIATDEDEIRQSARDYKKRALDQLVKYSKTMKALGENTNMKLELKNGELIYTGDM